MSLKAIALIVAVVMPADRPDIRHVERQPSFDVCWQAAKEFADRDLSDTLRSKGALGLKATCGYVETGEDDGELRP